MKGPGRFFYLKVDGSRYDQKFTSFESAMDFALTILKYMIKEKQIVGTVEVFDYKNKLLKSLSIKNDSEEASEVLS